jgi:P-type E1-E2 ATPase
MVSVDISGFGALRITHLVLDFNGTIAVDGRLLPGVRRRLTQLAERTRLHVITADTFGKARSQLKSLRCELVVLTDKSQDRAKAAYVRRLDASSTACIGNGVNDRLMLRAAALGIAVIQTEGAALASVLAADLIVIDVRDALDLFLKPLRLVAGLRT